MNGITVTENQSLFFQAEDKDGNVIATNSISIYQLGKLNPDNLQVNIDRSNNYFIYFTPLLINCDSTYYDLYCKIETDDTSFNICQGNNFFDSFNMISSFKDYYDITSGSTWKLNGTSGSTFKLLFKVVNKANGNIVLTKHYTLTFNTVDGPTIDSGIINSGTDYEQIMTPENDSNISVNNGLSANWDLDNSTNIIKDFFNNATDLLNVIISFLAQLPAWITTPLYILFFLAIIIFVFHLIRG